jgi:diguanylate cyclase (GGDEF)-like protein
MVDADGLKAANDERGHHFGDEFLQEVVRTVSATLSDGDLLARVGGDEFAVLLPGADEDRCSAVASEIDEALRSHRGVDGYPLSASVGHATKPPAASLAEAQRLADERMYQTKRR